MSRKYIRSKNHHLRKTRGGFYALSIFSSIIDILEKLLEVRVIVRRVIETFHEIVIKRQIVFICFMDISLSQFSPFTKAKIAKNSIKIMKLLLKNIKCMI